MNEENEELNKKCFYSRLWAKYDHSFFVMILVVYANAGLKGMNNIACQDLFKNYYGLEPAKTASLLSLIWLPWSLKLIYGVTADSISICGSNKKAWLIIMGLLQVICLTICATVHMENLSWFIVLQLLVNTSGSFSDVVIDAVMVRQAKRDLKYGSQEL